jgi:hypothetical protein
MSPEQEVRLSAARYALKTVWVAVQLILVYYLGQQGLLFFYQTF